MFVCVFSTSVLKFHPSLYCLCVKGLFCQKYVIVITGRAARSLSTTHNSPIVPTPIDVSCLSLLPLKYWNSEGRSAIQYNYIRWISPPIQENGNQERATAAAGKTERVKQIIEMIQIKMKNQNKIKQKQVLSWRRLTWIPSSVFTIVFLLTEITSRRKKWQS